MTKEEKQLLLIDLCARLPHGVYVTYRINKDEIERATIFNGNYARDIMEGRSMWIDFKPHLRSMSNMTEEEKKEYGEIIRFKPIYAIIDWLNKHMFDYRGLIPMGLAIEANEGVYNTKQ